MNMVLVIGSAGLIGSESVRFFCEGGFQALAGMVLTGLGLASIRTIFSTRDSALSRSRVSLYTRRLIFLRDLLHELIARDIKLRYKRKVLGTIWSLLNPLAHFLVLSFVFRYVLPLKIPNYTTFLFTGVLVWSWFRSSLHAATGTIVHNGTLIRRPGFPVAILPVVTVASHLIHFVLALPILLFFIYVGGIPITGAILVLPLVIVLQFFLTLSLAYLMATIHVTFRDTQYLLDILLLLGFYLSPIFYKADVIPPQYQPIYRLNPMVDLISAYRTILIEGKLPDLLPLLLLAIAVTVLLRFGYTIFMRASYRFVEEL